ncbi:MAG: aspartate aminotransferase family protein [Acidiferrobacterales bacterium]|nr:aspartate aminotransferase family protein [Acidiferrobacterales bacterium]
MDESHSLATEQLQKLDNDHHLHPFTDSKVLHDIGTRIVTHGDGIYIWDSEGHQIIDGMAGLWCVNIGYGREELTQAAVDQMRQLPYYNTFFMTSHPPVIALSEQLAKVTPASINHVFLTNSGSEANDTVIRMVRRYWSIRGKADKSVIISRHNAYHGSTVGAASLGGMSDMHAQGGLPIPGIRHIQQPYWYQEGGDLSADEFGLVAAQALEREIQEVGESNVAAFIAEPIQGAGGVIVPPDSYWPEISRICDRYEVLLVVDEVICGFGRTGKWFATDYYDLKPDLMVMAKGLSSGYLPIAAVAVSDGVADVLIEDGGEFAHGFTYSGHPVSCAVATENIRILEREGIIERVDRSIGPYFQQQLRTLEGHPLVGEIRGVGLIAGIEIVEDKRTRSRFDSELNVGIRCREFAARRGLIMRAVWNSMVLSPPLVITKSQINDLVEIVAGSLDDLMRDLRV